MSISITWNSTASGSPFNSVPANADDPANGAAAIRNVVTGLQERASNEISWYSDVDSDIGFMRAGSAKGYYGTTAPTKRADGVTNLNSSDAGRVRFDSTATSMAAIETYSGSGWIPVTVKSAVGTLIALTSGSGNWTVPANVKKIKVTAIGGGGNGSNSAGGYESGGGGSGGVCIAVQSVTPAASLAYVVGGAGTATTFNGMSAGGGSNGVLGNSSHRGYGGAGGTSSGGDINITGNSGGGTSSNNVAGDGAPGHMGGAGIGANFNIAATAGVSNTGAGGGGGGATTTAGGAGGSGIIIIEY